MALIPLIVLAELVLLARKKTGEWLPAIVAGVVAWATLLVLITEILSLVRGLSANWLAIVWTVCAVLAVVAYRMIPSIPNRRSGVFPAHPDLVDWLAAGFIAASVVLTFVVAIFAVPSLWDALTYHMPRVAHWAQNRSVAYYPTNIQRQLWSPPGAEFITLHFYVLSGSDRFLALVPWSAFVIAIAASSLIAKELGATPRGQLIASVFAASIPSAIAQSTGGEVDIVAGMWICCFVWLSLHLLHRDYLSWPLIILSGSSLGLTLLTKPTSYMFVTPFLIWFAAESVSRSWKKALVICLSVAVIAVAVNAFQYQRNERLYKRVIGGPGVGGTQNKVHSPGMVASNLVRNAFLHFGTRSPQINRALFDAVAASHRIFGMSVNDTSTTLVQDHFQPIQMSFSEANAGSPIHVVLLTVAGAFLILGGRNRSRRNVAYFVVAVAAGYFLFCILLKWGVGSARLHLPLLLLASAPVGVWIASLRRQSARLALTALLSVGALPPLLLNPDRPLVRHRPIYAIPRDERYFVEVRGLYPSYRGAADYIAAAGCGSIGLSTGWNDWEYPLWALLNDRLHGRVEIRHVQMRNLSRKLTDPDKTAFVPCAFVYVNNWSDAVQFTVPRGFAQAWQMDSITVFRPSEFLHSEGSVTQ